MRSTVRAADRERLAEARKPLTGLEIKEKESVSQLFQLKTLNKQDTWYPTLGKTVWVLSQLHDFVKVCLTTTASGAN